MSFRNNTITDVFFDLDHTLWDFEKNSALAFHRVFEKHNMQLDISRFLSVYEDINHEYWKLYREEKITKQELRRGRLNDTFSQLRLSFPVEIIDSLADAYIYHLPDNNHLFSGTIELLDYLHPSYNLHIITNGFEEVQYKKLKNSNIDGYFKTITNSERVGVKKPNPKIFHYALDIAGTNPGKSVMIGDNLEADILGAEAVGMKTIYFNEKKDFSANNRLIVSSILDIKNIL